MSQNKTKIYSSLYPLSILYGLGVHFRNLLFDWRWLRSRSFDIPVICVGNLAVGGTGKTPHIEYLIRLLSPHYRIAVLSRGYKRKSKGFQLADSHSTTWQVGDEPFQMHAKFPHIRVAVDADRCHGISQLLQQPEPPEVILLDDAYQHRYIKPGLSLLLTDFSRPFFEDTVLPAGRLRENAKGKNRADIIIVTKSPNQLSEGIVAEYIEKIKPKPSQSVFFSTLSYGLLQPVFPSTEISIPTDSAHILMVTGIAQPAPLQDYISQHFKSCSSMIYPDHHHFTATDIQNIRRKFEKIENKQKAIIVTEKDAVRLIQNPHIPDTLKPYFYYLPVEIVFLHNETKLFNQTILDYVAENNRNI